MHVRFQCDNFPCLTISNLAHTGGDDQTAAGISLFASSTKQQQQQYNQQQHDQLPEVHTNDPLEEANIIRKALRIKVKGIFSLLSLQSCGCDGL